MRQLEGSPKVIYLGFCGKIRLDLLSPGNDERILELKMSEGRIRKRPIWLLPNKLQVIPTSNRGGPLKRAK